MSDSGGRKVEFRGQKIIFVLFGVVRDYSESFGVISGYTVVKCVFSSHFESF